MSVEKLLAAQGASRDERRKRREQRRRRTRRPSGSEQSNEAWNTCSVSFFFTKGAFKSQQSGYSKSSGFPGENNLTSSVKHPELRTTRLPKVYQLLRTTGDVGFYSWEEFCMTVPFTLGIGAEARYITVFYSSLERGRIPRCSTGS